MKNLLRFPGRAATRPAAQAAAAKYIRPENLLVIVVGDKGKIESGLKHLKLGPIEEWSEKGASGGELTRKSETALNERICRERRSGNDDQRWSKFKKFLRDAKARTKEALDQAVTDGLKTITAGNAAAWFAFQHLANGVQEF